MTVGFRGEPPLRAQTESGTSKTFCGPLTTSGSVCCNFPVHNQHHTGWKTKDFPESLEQKGERRSQGSHSSYNHYRVSFYDASRWWQAALHPPASVSNTAVQEPQPETPRSLHHSAGRANRRGRSKTVSASGVQVKAEVVEVSWVSGDSTWV